MPNLSTFTGDEQCFGGPGLAGVSESFVLSRMENEFVDSKLIDSNKLVDKLGIPQFTQCHDKF
jgi:hypothetical protein